MRNEEYCKVLLYGCLEEYEKCPFINQQYRELGAIEAILLICEKLKCGKLPYKTKIIKYKKWYFFGKVLEKEVNVESYKELILRLANEFINEENTKNEK